MEKETKEYNEPNPKKLKLNNTGNQSQPKISVFLPKAQKVNQTLDNEEYKSSKKRKNSQITSPDASIIKSSKEDYEDFQNEISELDQTFLNLKVQVLEEDAIEKPFPDISSLYKANANEIQQNEEKTEEDAKRIVGGKVSEEKEGNFRNFFLRIIILDAKSSKKKKTPGSSNNRPLEVAKLLMDEELKSYFKRDPNNPYNVSCKSCNSSLVPRRPDLIKHLNTGKCKNFFDDPNHKNLLEKYTKGASEAKAEILWSFLTVMRNLSFNLSDFVTPIFRSMFSDSKASSKLKINRHKTKEIIEKVLLESIAREIKANMKNAFTMSFDHSRDVSNKNEFMISVAYLQEEPKIFIRRVVFEILEQNNTKASEIFKALNDIFTSNKLEYRSLLGTMSDNANEMIGEDNGLISHIKSRNNSLFHNTCICHSINLILSNLLKWASKSNDYSDFSGIPVFLNKIASYFNYSYKRENDYNNFIEDFLQRMKERKVEFYSDIKLSSFKKINRYIPTRFLSLGQAIKDLLPQWRVLHLFWQHQKDRKKELSLTSDQIQELEDFIETMSDSSFKFHLTVLLAITQTLNKENVNFQTDSSKLHVVLQNSHRLLKTFAKTLIKEDIYSNLEKEYESLADFKFISSRIESEEEFVENFNNIIDFTRPINGIDFSVNISSISSSEKKRAKKIIVKLCELIQNHLPLKVTTFKAFELLDIKKRKIKNSVSLFRDHLLKRFCRAYKMEDFEIILKEYEQLVAVEDEKLPMNPENYIESNL